MTKIANLQLATYSTNVFANTFTLFYLSNCKCLFITTAHLSEQHNSMQENCFYRWEKLVCDQQMQQANCSLFPRTTLLQYAAVTFSIDGTILFNHFQEQTSFTPNNERAVEPCCIWAMLSCISVYLMLAGVTNQICLQDILGPVVQKPVNSTQG